VAGISRSQIARTLNAGYASGLLSDDTFQRRLDELLNGALVEPARLIGDLTFRRRGRLTFRRWGRRRPSRLASMLRRPFVPRRVRPGAGGLRPTMLLGLDWSGARREVLIGRDPVCDLALADPAVSRRHARLRFRDGRWILQDLDSTNGTRVNGVRVGRCEVRPGDRLELGELQLTID
jgi:FHA domain